MTIITGTNEHLAGGGFRRNQNKCKIRVSAKAAPRLCDGWIIGGRGPPKGPLLPKPKGIAGSAAGSATSSNAAVATKLPWHDRHQVANSKDNARMPRMRRDYFDLLPHGSCINGEYHEVPKHSSSNMDSFAWTTPVDQYFQLQARFQKYPYLQSNQKFQDGQGFKSCKLGGRQGADPEWANQFQFEEDEQKVPVDLLLKALPSSNDPGEQEENDTVGTGKLTWPLSSRAESPRAQAARAPKNTWQLGSKPAKTTWQLGSAGDPPATVFEGADSETMAIHNTIKEETETHLAEIENARNILGRVSGQEQYSQFTKWCTRKFGSIVRFWRMIDTDGNMTISRTEFFSQLAAMKYPGDTKELWRLLDRDHSNSLSFLHFDPESALMIANFKRSANAMFGSITTLCQTIDADHSGKLSFSEFIEGCKKYNLDDVRGSLWCIFKMFGLCTESGDPSINVKDIAFLDTWECPEYLLVQPDFEGLERFKGFLVRRHRGNPIRAWRRDLDVDGSMRVNWLEFKQACSKVQHQTHEKVNIGGVWRAFDQNLSGWLSLGEFDSTSHEVLVRFKRMAEQEAGTVSNYVEQMDNKKGGDVPKSVFTRSVKKSKVFYQYASMTNAEVAEEPIEIGSDEEDEKNMQELGEKNLKKQELRTMIKHKRRSTLYEREEELAEMLFQGLDIDSTGILNPTKVRWLDRWNVDEEEAEEEAWQKMLEARERMHEEGDEAPRASVIQDRTSVITTSKQLSAIKQLTHQTAQARRAREDCASPSLAFQKSDSKNLNRVKGKALASPSVTNHGERTRTTDILTTVFMR